MEADLQAINRSSPANRLELWKRTLNIWIIEERKRARIEMKRRGGPRFWFFHSFEVEWRWGLKRAGLTFKLSFASPQTVNNGSDSDASQTMSIRLGLFTLDVRVDPEHQSILKINCKKHKIYCSSFRELPFSFSSWWRTLHQHCRSIASANIKA